MAVTVAREGNSVRACSPRRKHASVAALSVGKRCAKRYRSARRYQALNLSRLTVEPSPANPSLSTIRLNCLPKAAIYRS